jgi:hypothetical protein
MLTLKGYLLEARQKTSVGAELLSHLTHAKDLPHELPGPGHQYGVDMIHDFHKLRTGQPSSVVATHKVDGGASVVVGHDDKGPFVSDKHRHARGVVARSEEEIDQHFGHAPSYAADLKNVLEHAHHIVNKGHTVQGDLLFTEHSKDARKGQTVTAHANRLQYKMKTPAKLGIAIHTQISDGIAHKPSPKAISNHPEVFKPNLDFDHKLHKYSPTDRKMTEQHLDAAKKLIESNPDHSHLTEEHQKHFTVYMNRSTKNSKTPSIEGYKTHLHDEGIKKADTVKTENAKAAHIEKFKSLADHVDKNKEAFENSLKINHHLSLATEHVLKGIKHTDMQTSIDNKPSDTEGIVLLKKDEQRRLRPVAKLVPKEVSHKILNNPRFAKG